MARKVPPIPTREQGPDVPGPGTKRNRQSKRPTWRSPRTTLARYVFPITWYVPTHRVLVMNPATSIVTGALDAVSAGPLANAGAAMLTTHNNVHTLMHTARALVKLVGGHFSRSRTYKCCPRSGRSVKVVGRVLVSHSPMQM